VLRFRDEEVYSGLDRLRRRTELVPFVQ
jgi:hypothetical protein